jgi:hypothetical protein
VPCWRKCRVCSESGGGATLRAPGRDKGAAGGFQGKLENGMLYVSCRRHFPALAILMLTLVVAACDEIVMSLQPDEAGVDEMIKEREHEGGY